MNSDVKKDVISTSEVLNSYLNPGEEIVGTGLGGSESLTIFLKKPDQEKIIVRKILSEKLITARWDREGTDVMLAPFKKAKQQALFLKHLPERVKPYFPIVEDIIERSLGKEGNDNIVPINGECKELIYDMSYIEGIEVSEFVRKNQPSPEVVARLYTVIFTLLNQVIHSCKVRAPSTPTLEASYFNKIEKRLELAVETAPQVFSEFLLDSKYIYIDGIRYLNIKPLLAIFRETPEYTQILEPTHHSLVMGDTNTENIKITKPDVLLNYIAKGDLNFSADDIGLKFLDPRAIGFHENGEDTGSDDPMYDNKPWHNSLGNYDLIHSEYFDLNVNRNINGMSIEVVPYEDHPYAIPYKDIESHFQKVMTEAWQLDKKNSSINTHDPYWLARFAFVMGTHFAAMPPFHFHKNEDGSFSDDYVNQRRPVAIYAEGIKWLNLALRMLQKRVTQFYGLPVTVNG